jgi:hypothetical protein
VKLMAWQKFVWVALVACLVVPAAAAADNQVGGHFGFVVPMVTRVNGESTTVSDDFKIGFPMGISVKRSGSRMAFDLELVPLINDTNPTSVTLTVHPGLVWDLGHRLAGGVRAAFDINQASWGFTPLLAYGFPQANGTTLFTELDLPVRFQDDFAGNNETAVTVAIHLGWAF